MMKFRVSVLLCLVVAVSTMAYAQDFRTPKYTAASPDFATHKRLVDEAAWYVKAWNDPLKTVAEDSANVQVYLGKNPYEVEMLKQQTPEALRKILSTAILARVAYDPIFEAVLNISQSLPDDQNAAIHGAQLLVDSLNACMQQYPGVKNAAKDILIADLDSQWPGVRYVAVKGLGMMADSPAPAGVEQALLKQLESEDEVIVSAAATSLARLGSRAAVPLLMERFNAIPENVDNTVIRDAPEAAMSAQGQESSEPLNQARFCIATAVDRIAGLNLGIGGKGIYNKDEVLALYGRMTEWWEQNKATWQ